MSAEDLSELDLHVIKQCLVAAADGPFFPDREFPTLTGLHKHEVRAVAKRWPDVDFDNDDVRLAVNNALVNLIGYPHDVSEKWSDWISIPRDELPELLSRWRGERPGSYFDALM